MGVEEIKDKADFDAKTKGSGNKLVVVDFFADWCGPCRMIGPKIEIMSNEHLDVLFLKVNVDEMEDVAAECGISAMPTFLFYKNGEKVGELVGADESKIRDLVKMHK